MKPASTLSAAASILLMSSLHAAEGDEKWVNLFNGKDLSNWEQVNCAPETWTVADGVIKCTGKPTGALRTPRMYENFIMEVEWRHMKSGGNAGIFIWSSPIPAPGVPFLRAIEVQVLDHGYGNTKSYTTHGDVFPIHGSTMVPFGEHNGMRSFPSERRSKPSPEWNHYRIECRDGVLRLSVNGKEVSGGEKCVWRKGYVGLESEGAPTEWRVVRIQELPPGNATADESAPEKQGHRSLYSGVDLRGWKTEDTERWKSSDWQLVAKPGAEATKPLWSEEAFGDSEFIIDCKSSAKTLAAAPKLFLRGPQNPEAAVDLPIQPGGKWARFTVTVKGQTATVTPLKGESRTYTLPEKAGTKGQAGLLAPMEGAEFANIFVRGL